MHPRWPMSPRIYKAWRLPWFQIPSQLPDRKLSTIPDLLGNGAGLPLCLSLGKLILIHWLTDKWRRKTLPHWTMANPYMDGLSNAQCFAEQAFVAMRTGICCNTYLICTAFLQTWLEVFDTPASSPKQRKSSEP